MNLFGDAAGRWPRRTQWARETRPRLMDDEGVVGPITLKEVSHGSERKKGE